MARPAPISTTSCRLATWSMRARHEAVSRLRPGDGARCFPECRHRSDPGARDASRAGGRSVDAGSLVAIRSPQRPRASFRRGGARPPRSLAPPPQPHPLQLARSRGSARVWISTHRGRLDMRVLQGLNVPRNARLLHLRTVRLHERSHRRPCGLGRRAEIASTPRCSAPVRPLRRASPLHRAGRRICRPGLAGAGALVSFARSGLSVRWGQRSKACSSWPRLATCPCDGRAERGSATPVRPGLWRGQSATSRTRSIHRRTAMC